MTTSHFPGEAHHKVRMTMFSPIITYMNAQYICSVRKQGLSINKIFSSHLTDRKWIKIVKLIVEEI